MNTSRIDQDQTMTRTVYLLATLCLIHLSTAQECRNLLSVINSARDVQTNVNVGGHLWTQIPTLLSRPRGYNKNHTQLYQTLFADEDEFAAAYAKAQALTTGSFAICPDGGGRDRRDEILASAINITRASYCTDVIPQKLYASGLSYSMMGRYVTFKFVYCGDQWILRTAYPNHYEGVTNFTEDVYICPENIFTTEDNRSGAVALSSRVGAILLTLVSYWLLFK